jgi:thioredoxin 1
MTPAVETAVQKHDSVELCSVNVDEDPTLAAKHGVRAIPTLVLIRDGEAAGRLIGSRSSDEIDQFISTHR